MGSRFEAELRSAEPPRPIAELAAAGVTPAVLRGPRWRRSSRGFYVPASVALTPTQRILELAPLVPCGGAITGWAAAFALGTDLLDGLNPHTMTPLPATVLVGSDLGRADITPVRFRRARLEPEEVLKVARLFLTTPLRTCVEAILESENFVESVVAADLVCRALGLDLESVTRWCDDHGRLRGLDRIRKALAWADPAIDSPWETRLRLFYRQQAGLPKPLVNRPVFNLEERLIGIPDLFDPEAGLATEFDGKDHRSRRQHRADNLREEDLESANLTVCRVDSLDLRSPVPLCERLCRRYAQGMARDRSRDQWTLRIPDWWRRRRAA